MDKDSIVAKNMLLHQTCKTCHWAWPDGANTIYCHNDMGFLDDSVAEMSRNVRMIDSYTCEHWEIKDGR